MHTILLNASTAIQHADWKFMVNSLYNFRFYLTEYTKDCEWKIIWSATMLRQWFAGQQVFLHRALFLRFYLVPPHNNSLENQSEPERYVQYMSYALMLCITNLLEAKKIQTITKVQIFVELTVFVFGVGHFNFFPFPMNADMETVKWTGENSMENARWKGPKKPRRQTPHIKIVYCIRLTYAIMYTYI